MRHSINVLLDFIDFILGRTKLLPRFNPLEKGTHGSEGSVIMVRHICQKSHFVRAFLKVRQWWNDL